MHLFIFSTLIAQLGLSNAWKYLVLPFKWTYSYPIRSDVGAVTLVRISFVMEFWRIVTDTKADKKFLRHAWVFWDQDLPNYILIRFWRDFFQNNLSVLFVPTTEPFTVKKISVPDTKTQSDTQILIDTPNCTETPNRFVRIPPNSNKIGKTLTICRVSIIIDNF